MGIGRQLTGVGAAAAGTVEVHRRAVPEGVACEVDVHVGGHRRVQPAVAGEEGFRFAVDVGQVVEARARRVGVAGAADTRAQKLPFCLEPLFLPPSLPVSA